LACEPNGQKARSAGLPYQGYGKQHDGGPQGKRLVGQVDSKFKGWNDADWKEAGFSRCAKLAVVRKSAFIAAGRVLMRRS